MIRLSIAIAALGASAVAAGPVAAQATPAVPGSSNSAQVANHNREQNAGFNRVVGAMESAAPGKVAGARRATAADIVVGASLRDVDGKSIGTIFSVDSEGAVVASGESRIKVPLIAFGKDDSGLLLAVTEARFKELMAKAKSSPK